jgi:hypothetical protein
MATRQMLEEILSNEFSSQAQKDQAQAGLYKLDNPERIVDLTEPTVVAPVAPAAKFTSYVPAHRMGLLISGLDYTDPVEGYSAADAAARLRCPEFDGTKYRAQQRQESADACACTRAYGQDMENRMAIIRAAHPTWDSIQCSKEFSNQDESHTKFVLVNGVIEKRKYDNKWVHFEVVPIAVAPSVVPVAVAVAPIVALAPVPIREATEAEKQLKVEFVADLHMRRQESAAKSLREQRPDVRTLLFPPGPPVPWDQKRA